MNRITSADGSSHVPDCNMVKTKGGMVVVDSKTSVCLCPHCSGPLVVKVDNLLAAENERLREVFEELDRYCDREFIYREDFKRIASKGLGRE